MGSSDHSSDVIQWSRIWHSPLSALWPSVLPLVSLRPHLKPRQQPPNMASMALAMATMVFTITAILPMVAMGMEAMVPATATTTTAIPIMVATLVIITMERGLLMLLLSLKLIRTFLCSTMDFSLATALTAP